jgi:hypothetical protein
MKAKTDFQQRSTLEQLDKAYQDLKKYEKVVEKRKRIEEDRREYSEQLQRLNRERLQKIRDQHLEELKQRDKWSVSVLQKHKQ